eukprot:scaffold92125_cov49-Prasinocladus_malaysianus.AAC.1
MYSTINGWGHKWESGNEDHICGTNTICALAYGFQSLLLKLSANLILLATVSVQTMPPSLWSSAVVVAAERTGNLRMKRLQWLPLAASKSYLLFLIGIVHQQTRLAFMKADKLEAGIAFFVMLAATLYNCLLVWIAMVPHDMLTLITGSKEITTLTNSNKIVPGSAASSAFSHKGSQQSAPFSKHSDASIENAAKRGSSYFKELYTRLHRLLGLSACGSRSQQEIILCVQLMLWSDRVITRTELSECIAMYLLRAFACAMLLNARDLIVTHKDITSKPGFGLLVSASHFRRCLNASLGGQPCPVQSLPTYKATPARMMDTLAVSYRWQPQESAICPGQTINMSPFQMKAVQEAIQFSGATYVWLDRLSVPQEDNEL